jgi:hypothetical protein
VNATPVAQKLLVKPGKRFWISDGSKAVVVGPLPDGAQGAERLADADVALLFAADAAAVQDLLAAHRDDLSRPEALWIAYPKGGRADINRDSLWPIAAEYGLRPITQIALDEVWSALRFRPLKPGEKQFTGGRR